MSPALKCFFFLLLIGCFPGCKKPATVPDPAPPPDTSFVKGADIGWLTEMEAQGRKFYNKAGIEQDLMLILKNLGINTIRIRVWVNPVNGWNNKADVIAKALRAKSQGMRVLINFHYSDTWADPAHQTQPATWTGQDMASLKNALADHTRDVLTALKLAGISPEWVQVGNETNDGMLWPEGKASFNMANFAQLVATGYDAVKSVFPSAKVIVHVSNGWDNSLFRWLFDGLKSKGGKWDIIGMSLYPNATNWSSLNTQCLNNMMDMIARYGKEVMIVEVGMSWDQDAASYSFLTDIIAKTKSLEGDKGLGVIYWEPEAYGNWQGYTLGAFDDAGKPTTALDAFK